MELVLASPQQDSNRVRPILLTNNGGNLLILCLVNSFRTMLNAKLLNRQCGAGIRLRLNRYPNSPTPSPPSGVMRSPRCCVTGTNRQHDKDIWENNGYLGGVDRQENGEPGAQG